MDGADVRGAEPAAAGAGHAAQAGERQGPAGDDDHQSGQPGSVVEPEQRGDRTDLHTEGQHQRPGAGGADVAGLHDREGALGVVGGGEPVGGVGEAVEVEGAAAEGERAHGGGGDADRCEAELAAGEAHERHHQPEGDDGQRREHHRRS